MTSIKKQLIDLIKRLPDKLTYDEIMEEIHFKAQVLEGVRQLDSGKGVPHAEVKKRVQKWFSK